MQIAMIGLGRMGANMVRRLMADGHDCVVHDVAEDPIVSSDVRSISHSGVFDSLATMVTGGNLVKTITWFNNGWGYSNRVVEVTGMVAAFLNGE